MMDICTFRCGNYAQKVITICQGTNVNVEHAHTALQSQVRVSVSYVLSALTCRSKLQAGDS
jgi:hypothetical protein